MAHYIQLSLDERYTISAELKRQTSIRQISRMLGRSPSSISRELKRNTGQRGYKPKQATKKTRLRKAIQTRRLTDFALAFIEHQLYKKWSPEQIHGALTAKGWLDVPSHEWIYLFIYRNKRKGGLLYKQLRAQKTYRKRGFAANDRRGVIANRTSIHERPQEIENRYTLGHYEGDTMIGAKHKGALLTLVDRKSLYTLIRHLPSKHALITAEASVAALKRVGALSVTFDNGKEFAQHALLKSKGIDVYFADAYCSNQRARNENTNGLIRQYLPKGMSFECLSPEEVSAIQDELNNRPRKTLNWLSPNELQSRYGGVALRL